MIQLDQKELEKVTGELKDTIVQPPDKPQREKEYNLHVMKGDSKLGTEKQGVLFKRSEGIVRKIWQKRICEVSLYTLLGQKYLNENQNLSHLCHEWLMEET